MMGDERTRLMIASGSSAIDDEIVVVDAGHLAAPVSRIPALVELAAIDRVAAIQPEGDRDPALPDADRDMSGAAQCSQDEPGRAERSEPRSDRLDGCRTAQLPVLKLVGVRETY